MSANQDNVARGLKAALNNPNVSEEAKQRDAARLQEMGYGETEGSGRGRSGNTDHLNSGRTHEENVARGLKAAINNPNVSEEAKQRDIERLQEMGETVDSSQKSGRTGGGDEEISNRVLGGYKATLSNPNTSDAAKARAEEVLEEYGS